MNSQSIQIIDSIRRSAKKFNDDVFVYLGLSFIFVVLFIFLLMLNEVFTQNVAGAVTDIYQIMVTSYQSGASVNIQSQITDSLIYLGVWMIEFLILLVIVSTMLSSVLLSDKKLVKKELFISLGIGIICAAIVSVFKILGNLFPYDFLLTFGIATSISLISFAIKWNELLKWIAKISLISLIWTIVYFAMLILQFLFSLVLLKSGGADPYLKYGVLLEFLFLIINLIFIHMYVNHLSGYLTGIRFFSSLRNAFKVQKILLSAIWLFSFIVFVFVLWLILLMKVQYVSQILFAAGLGIGSVIYFGSVVDFSKDVIDQKMSDKKSLRVAKKSRAAKSKSQKNTPVV